MLIEWNGHSEFLLESASGYRVLTDPFDPNTGYPMRRPGADAVVVSHGHGDHSYVQKAPRAQVIADRAGRVSLAPGESATVTFDVSPDQLAWWSEEQGKSVWTVSAGDYRFRIGPSSAELPLEGCCSLTGKDVAKDLRDVYFPEVSVSREER